jgi:hypothetical protein
VAVSVLPAVSADWLELRAAADAAARSAELAEAAAALVAAGPLVVHDLGSGTGAMLRWLAPRLPLPQTWVLHDADAGLLRRATHPGHPVTVRTSVEPLDALRPADLAGASLVTASALLDVLTVEEAGAVVDAVTAVGAPALLSLSVTGVVELQPADRLDSRLQAAFNDHQRRTLHGRRLLGPDAVDVVEARFRDAGWWIRRAETPWRLGPADGRLPAAWLDGWLAAATEQVPALADDAVAYRRRRLDQLAAGALRATVQHRDLLAWPG